MFHWTNAYLLLSSDPLGHWHDLIDICLHTVMHVLVLGSLTFKLKSSNLLLLAGLRLLLELGWHQMEEEIYGRRRQSVFSMEADYPGTFGYVLLELAATVVAAAPSWQFWKSLKSNVVLLDLRRNAGGVWVMLLYHWGYIIAANLYIRTKIPWIFHTSHVINLLAVPIIMPCCQYMYPVRLKKH